MIYNAELYVHRIVKITEQLLENVSHNTDLQLGLFGKQRRGLFRLLRTQHVYKLEKHTYEHFNCRYKHAVVLVVRK